jgi:hypothetical protein
MEGKCSKACCCCNCNSQMELTEPPKKNVVSKHLGYVCTVCLELTSCRQAYFFEGKHGLCELWNKRK